MFSFSSTALLVLFLVLLAFFLDQHVTNATESIVSPSLAPTSFEIDAWAMDRGNFAVFTEEYCNGGPPIIANGGYDPAEVEYDIPFPLAGKYRFSVFVAMSDIRPLAVFLDSEKIGDICRAGTTPTWNSCDAHWDAAINMTVPSAGIHTLKIMTIAGPPPHLAKLRFESDQPFPEDWTLNRPKANKLPPVVVQFQGETNLTATEPNPEAIRRAIIDLIETYGEKYPKGLEYLKQLDTISANDEEQLTRLRYEAVFQANPVFDFEQILLIRRNNKGAALGFPQNWESNSSLPKGGYDDEIMSLSVKSPENDLVSWYKPNRDTLISDLDLNFEADRLMFSAVGANDRWHIFELSTADHHVRQLTTGDRDVDFYDSCYLPDGRIILTCTASMVGVPCVAGSSHVANLFLFDPENQSLRQLCFDQEHNWCPTMLNDGRVMYTRWEYADTPHSNTRFLFHCNPDGTSQLEYYGSNSYWPNSIFFTRAIPNHPTKIVGVISGHHDNGRIGELVILDPAISRREADGAVQKIPGFGKKVETVVADGLTRRSWPKFAHPYPLSEKYFLVAAKPTPISGFGIYLVDTFDNMILLKELPGNALLQPVALKKTKRPPIIPDRVDLARDDASIFISNILDGPGLEGIPPETVKKLRVYTYHFAYQNSGGLLGSVGQDGPWDVRGVLGTVPVEADGSVHFRAPANLPIAVLPLDENGQALQLMRSWMTAMPGEYLHCNGCHESQNSTPSQQPKHFLAMQKLPAEIEPYNPPKPDAETLLGQLNVRGFSFHEEIQPILDRYCISCHNGEAEKNIKTAIVSGRHVGTSFDGKPFAIDLRGDRNIEGWTSDIGGNSGYMNWGGKWTVGYDNLQRFVRRPGIESDYALFSPMEYAANTTELVQILKQGHYNVKLDPTSWEKLITWIDMNTPFHGNWTDITGKQDVEPIAKRRLELAELYGAESIDFEKTTPEPPKYVPEPVSWQKTDDIAHNKLAADIPVMTPEEAAALQAKFGGDSASGAESGGEIEKTMDLGDGQIIILRRIPAYGALKRPFWMGTCEITNAQFRKFDPNHDSRHESRLGYQFGRRGYDVNDDGLPVVRVNWNKAVAFCRWLSEKTGLSVNLPTENQWEHAARAGTRTPFWFGHLDTDFSPFANIGDRRLKEYVTCSTYQNYTNVRIIPNPNPFDDRLPKDERFDDGYFLQTEPGQYKPNPFGLYDMIGNVAEWTRSELVVDPSKTPEKIVKGGSWFDRPYRCTSDFRVSYPPYQPVFNVGFRVIIEDNGDEDTEDNNMIYARQ